MSVILTAIYEIQSISVGLTYIINVLEDYNVYMYFIKTGCYRSGLIIAPTTVT